MAPLISLIAFVVIVSFLFAMVEAALFSVPLTRAKLLAEKGGASAQTFLKIKENPGKTIATTVLLNNVNNIVGSIFIGYVTTHTFGDSALGLVSAIATFFIIIVGEIVPKTIGENYAEGISLTFAGPLRGVTWLLYPITYLLEGMTKRFLKKKKFLSIILVSSLFLSPFHVSKSFSTIGINY